MTKTRNRFVALFAIAVLALGLGFMTTAPQKAHAAETKLAAGATFQQARDITPKKGGTVAKKASGVIPKGALVVTQRNLATFSTDNENHYYKFTTSSRNSIYRITVRKEADDGRGINVEIRNAKLQRFNYDTVSEADRQYRISFDSGAGRIERNATYYIELSRYVPKSQISGTIDRSPYVDYRITVEEIVPKPAAISKSAWTYKLYTKSKKIVVDVTRRSFYADGYQIRHYVPRLHRWYTTSFSGVSKTFRSAGVNTTIKLGSRYWGFLAKIRPYRVVNGIKFYGNWSGARTKWDTGEYVKCIEDTGSVYLKNSSGNKVRCKKETYVENTSGAYVLCKKSATSQSTGTVFKKGQYYKYSDVSSYSTSDQKAVFKFSSGKIVRYKKYAKNKYYSYNTVKKLTNSQQRAGFDYSGGKLVRYQLRSSGFTAGKYYDYSTVTNARKNIQKNYFETKSDGTTLQRYTTAKPITVVSA